MPMVGEVRSMGVFGPLTVETALDPTVQGFLDDHRIDGVPVLPGVMGVEAFAEVAALMAPGWQAASIEDITFDAPFKFYRDEPRQITIEACLTPEGNELVANCRLIGARMLPNQPEPQITTHFTGRVRLARHLQSGATTAPPMPPDGAGVVADAIYKVYFHGPAYRVLDRSWRQGDRQIGLLAEGLPANHQPPELPLLTAPRLLELCFQTAASGSWGRRADWGCRRRSNGSPCWSWPRQPGACTQWSSRGLITSTPRWSTVPGVFVCAWRATAAWPCRRRSAPICSSRCEPRCPDDSLPLLPHRHRQPGRGGDAPHPRRPGAQSGAGQPRSCSGALHGARPALHVCAPCR